MVDEVKIVQIDNTVVQQLGWAREVTLGKLLDQAESQTGLLSAIAKSRNIDISKIRVATKKIEEDLNDAGDLFNDTAKKVQSFQQENERAARRQREEEEKALRDKYEREGRDYRNLQRSVGSLRDGLGKLQRATPSSAFDLLTEKTAIFGGRLTEDGKKAGAVLTGFSRALAVAGFAFGALTSITDAFRPMVESGLLFEGSAVKFARAAYDSGLGLEQFTRIAGQYSQTVSAVGEQAYSDSIKRFRDSSRQFGYFGMNSAELADAQTRYMEIMRESGTLFYMTAQQQEAATTSYLTELTKLSVLQGRSRKQLEEEQARARRKAQIALTIERIRQTEGDTVANEVLKNYGKVVSESGESFADLAFAGQFNLGGPTREEAAALAPSGLLAQAMAPVDFRSAQSTDVYNQNALQAVRNIPTDVLDQLARQARYGGPASAAAKFLGEGERSMLIRARPRSDRVIAAADAAGRGQIVDKQTTDILAAQVAATESMNNLKSAALGAADSLGIFTTVAKIAAIGGTLGAEATGFLSGAVGSTVGAAGTIGTALLMRRLLSGGAGAAALRTPAMPTGFLPPATPAVGGGSALGGALLGGTKAIAGGSMLGGLLSGGTEYAQSGNFAKSLFVGGGSLIGGLFGGIGGSALAPGLGTIAGGIGGSIVGEQAGRALYSSIFGPDATPGTPAGAATAPAASADFGARFDQLAQRLGRQGPIVIELQNISNQMERMIGGIDRLRGAVEAR